MSAVHRARVETRHHINEKCNTNKEVAMLRTLKLMEGGALEARDGTLGQVKDFHFGELSWAIRYLVVETGAWLNKRRVLISPEAMGPIDSRAQVFPVNLTIEQVRNSPPTETDKPVSRQAVVALNQHYGWTPYWSSVFGPGGLAAPIVQPVPAESSPMDHTDGNRPLHERGDPDLHSVSDTRGHSIEATDGAIGHVQDFLADVHAWRIRYLVIDTRNWWPGKKVIIAPAWIRDVSWKARAVFIDLTREAIKNSPPYDESTAWHPDYGRRLHDHYGKPPFDDLDYERPSSVQAEQRRR